MGDKVIRKAIVIGPFNYAEQNANLKTIANEQNKTKKRA